VTEFDTLVARIRATLDLDEQIAKAASGAWGGITPTGENWHWECGNCDTDIVLDPVTVLDGYVQCSNCASDSPALRSVEQYPASYVGELGHHVINTEELAPADALHLARHDPARVLTTVAALREVLDICVAELGGGRALHAALSALDRIGANRG
jgi:hypothetical protein